MRLWGVRVPALTRALPQPLGRAQEQDQLPPFPIFLTQRQTRSPQILGAVGAFHGLHGAVAEQGSAGSAAVLGEAVWVCRTGLSCRGDVSPQSSH